MKGFARELVLKPRTKITRKWLFQSALKEIYLTFYLAVF